MQSGFYSHGVESHQKCALFPGAFARVVRQMEAEREEMLASAQIEDAPGLGPDR